MGIFSGLERRLRGAVDGTFARIFGGSVQPAEVTSALQREAAAGVTHHAGRAVAPNRYTVELGPSDSADVGDDIRRVSAALQASLDDYVRGQGWDTYAAVQVTLRESDRLHTGQFRVSSLVDPGVDAINPYDVSPAVADPQRRGMPPAPGSDVIDAYPATGGAQGYEAQGYGAQGYGAQPPAAGPGYGQPQYYEPDPFAILPGGYAEPSYPEAPAYPPPGDDQSGYGQQPYGGQRFDQPRYQDYPPIAPAAQPIAAPHLPDTPSQLPGSPASPPRQGAGQIAAPRLIVEDGTGRSYTLRRGSNIVGRGQSSALRLADTAVSREHLDVYFDGQAAVVHDLGSTNGTTVNGSPIQTWQLAEGDVIRVGTSTVVYSAR